MTSGTADRRARAHSAMPVVIAADEHAAPPPPAPAPPVPVAVDVSDDARRARVQQAFALGWHVAELCYWQDRERPPSTDEGHLRQLGALDGATRLRLLVAQISADLDGLGVERSGPVRPLRGMGRLEDRTVDPLANLDAIDVQSGAEQVKTLHTAILLRLTVKDYELGKAYSLGARLGQTVFQAYEKV